MFTPIFMTLDRLSTVWLYRDKDKGIRIFRVQSPAKKSQCSVTFTDYTFAKDAFKSIGVEI